LNKRVLRIAGVVIGVFLLSIPYLLLTRGILTTHREQDTLQDRISMLRSALEAQREQQNPIPTREAQLATLEAQKAEVQITFPTELDSTRVLSHVVTTALHHQIDIRRVDAREALTDTVGTGTYHIFAYDLEVEGTMDRTLAFLSDLETGPVETLNLNRIQLQDMPEPTPTPVPMPAAVITPTATPTSSPVEYRTSLIVQFITRQWDSGPTPTPTGDTETRTRGSGRLDALLEDALQVEDWDRAISLLLVMRQLDPGDETLDEQLVEAYVQSGRRRLEAAQFERAADDFEDALEIDPENSIAQIGLATAEAKIESQ